MRINKNALVKCIVRLFGMEAYKPGKYPKDFGREAIETIKTVTPYTMVSPDSLFSLITAIRYIAKNRISGSIVECGVWRGGAMGAAALTLKSMGESRDMYLFDTFDGMTAPAAVDKTIGGTDAMLVNEGLVLYVVDEANRKYPLADMTVGLLGMAFKADVDDTRASLSYKMKNALKAHAKEVLTTDPHVTSDAEIKPLDEVLAKNDLLVLCTPHGAYKDLDVGETPLIDIWRYICSRRV